MGFGKRGRSLFHPWALWRSGGMCMVLFQRSPSAGRRGRSSRSWTRVANGTLIRAELCWLKVQQSGRATSHFLKNLRQRKDSGLRDSIGADRALCGVADAISAIWVDAARKSGVRFAQSMSPKASRR